MKQRSLKNQHRMLEVLLERFDAVDVTGLSAWERARAVHGRAATGLGEGVATPGERLNARASSDSPGATARGASTTPSPSSVATPLFTEEAA